MYNLCIRCIRLYSCFYRMDIFFFKQKTAYDMRISDWSSDVCSSDLQMRKVGFLNVPSASIIHQIRLFYAAIVGIEALLSNNMSAVTQAAVMGLQEADEVQRPSELILSKQDGAYRNLASDERAGLVDMSRRLSLAPIPPNNNDVPKAPRTPPSTI